MRDDQYENRSSLFKEFISDIITKKDSKITHEEIYQLSRELTNKKTNKRFIILIYKHVEYNFKKKFININSLKSLEIKTINELNDNCIYFKGLIKNVFSPIIYQYEKYNKLSSNYDKFRGFEGRHEYYFYNFFREFLISNKNLIMGMVITSLKNLEANPDFFDDISKFFSLIDIYKVKEIYLKKIEDFLVYLYDQKWSEEYKTTNLNAFLNSIFSFFLKEEKKLFMIGIISSAKKRFLRKIFWDFESYKLIEIIDNEHSLKCFIAMFQHANLEDKLLVIFSKYIRIIIDRTKENFDTLFCFHFTFLKLTLENILRCSSRNKNFIIFIDNQFKDFFSEFENQIIEIANYQFNDRILNGLKNEIPADFYKKNLKYFHEGEKSLMNYSNIKVTDEDFMFYFSYIKNKKDFSERYRIFLSNRLLSRKSDILVEKKIVNEMKNNVPIIHIHRLERMISDIEIYSNTPPNSPLLINPHRWPKLNKSKFLATDIHLKLLQNLTKNQIKENREKYIYDWCYSASTCEVELNGETIIMGIIQYEVIKLVLSGSYTKKEINTNLRLEEDDRNIEALLSHKLLFEDDTKTILFNQKLEKYPKNICVFEVSHTSNDKILRNVKNEDDAKNWLNYYLDCKIVNKLKNEKKMKKSLLIAHIKSLRPEITKNIFDERIEYLTKCEFLEARGLDLIYIP